MEDGYEKVFWGAHCEVWFAPKVLETYNNGRPEDKAMMERILDYLCENGPQDLNNEKFKAEARYLCTGGKKAMVYVAKAYQLRIYGCFQKGPPRALVCPEAVFKKKNKADQRLLERVAKKVGE